MLIIRSVKQLVKAIDRLKKEKKRIGFVPTMGFLHEGHLSLVRRARKENGCVVVSIFVNPIQFGPTEDFARYPRSISRDRQMLEKEHADILFLPEVNEIYPKGFNRYVQPGLLAKGLCGRKRPGHFRGVTTVVNRLFELVRPDRAYFGKKDYQQAKVIEAMVKRLGVKVKICLCELIRDFDGVAISSRNQYLSPEERIRAKALYQSLKKARRLIQSGIKDISHIRSELEAFLKAHVDQIDYVEIVNSENLKPLKRISGRVLVAIACFVGRTRLIDNRVIKG
ncbi:MAG: pantoate--beta-alanine ligase [Omnitrophica bacterium RIFCSPLOWO2_12_FULL_44_17]|uniref:Pantothenate synthetase n=1 Tax=Candidatus Danuiimicrobium aquiferis TaxID=1801832 RepID=A0A1G1L215_9BACT|nr:MAG: pantoate--beta-alanine ligase [Omnitrophica bacterium RIFCSPHIGHO2_02_FULL_45_28]OGW99202.1 MAG: pantoate--beta-alanine ligase [Omnitrophica bacterium RIFCSPLOWO2_12_FULL_44_17]OGX04382.1 MAG: pantoate--beta-alanine ligase [Omnitrophica bacterium RIFCSPLOWO2_02_FULL_44_11]